MSKKLYHKKSISIRTDEKMSKMLEVLENSLLLNTTSVMRLALVTLYNQQIDNKLSNTKGDE